MGKPASHFLAGSRTRENSRLHHYNMWLAFFVLLIAATATHHSHWPTTLLLDESVYTYPAVYDVPYYSNYYASQVPYTYPTYPVMEAPVHRAVPIVSQPASIPLRPAVPFRPAPPMGSPMPLRPSIPFRPNNPYRSAPIRQPRSPSNWDLFIGLEENPITGMAVMEEDAVAAADTGVRLDTESH
eukprot:Protomagalhaensia_wolfi_Nauph_80__758@NODE_1436_length_1531_cov_9_444370_g1110_i0_p1_GENE_NODE_1436_length_1531_cov_9_444370_g1110_i0NODE_1436_length_1531_cov_9_444370_g1110_i0_p1_ORF_typecomplete_len184_score10_64Amelogenin/PF02948_15/0_057_NODE_1436_length_1531_cov_9_444370_g1110_i089640